MQNNLTDNDSGNLEAFEIVDTFIATIIEESKAKECLKISYPSSWVLNAQAALFDHVDAGEWEVKVNFDRKFDFIFCDFLSRKHNERVEVKYGEHTVVLRKNWTKILESASLINENCIGLYVVEPYFFNCPEGCNVITLLSLKGKYLNAVFKAPEYIRSFGCVPAFVLFSNRQTDSIFIAELVGEIQASEVVRCFFSGKDSQVLMQGVRIRMGEFQGFERYKIKQQIYKLETQYKEFEECTLEQVTKELHSCGIGETLQEKNNAIYIPLLGNSPVVTKISDISSSHLRYLQIELNEKAKSEYLLAFFRSTLGELVLKSLKSEYRIRRIYIRDLMTAPIALPPIIAQERIVSTYKKLQDLKLFIDKFNSELALNPMNSEKILGQLNSMLESIGGLSDSDEVRELIRQGESKLIEFKETLSLDIKTQTKEKRIELSALKTVVAFLNTEGGVLLIGVRDDGSIAGVEVEIDKFYRGSSDNFLLHFRNLLKEKVGEQYYPYIEYKLVKISDVNILVVKCERSTTPCFLGNIEFYVRTNPATDKLEGLKLVQYVKNHFV